MDDHIVHGEDTPADVIPALLNSVEFDNQVLLRVSNRKELLVTYKNAEALCAELKKELSAKIE